MERSELERFARPVTPRQEPHLKNCSTTSVLKRPSILDESLPSVSECRSTGGRWCDDDEGEVKVLLLLEESEPTVLMTRRSSSQVLNKDILHQAAANELRLAFFLSAMRTSSAGSPTISPTSTAQNAPLAVPKVKMVQARRSHPNGTCLCVWSAVS